MGSENFRGLLYAPSYEQEVVMLFGMLLPYLDYKLEIDEYTDEFPDCFAKLNGDYVGIEFEVNASNFRGHKHHLHPNLPNCGWLVCWKNDLGKDPLIIEQKETKQPVTIRIIELSKTIEKLKGRKGLEFILNPLRRKRLVSIWDKDKFLKQLEENIDNKEYNLVNELLEFCEKNKELEVVYSPHAKIASLVVRVKRWGKIAPLGAMANGTVYFAFRDASKFWVYPSKEIEVELRRRFNQPETSYYKNYRIKDTETLNKIKEALRWLTETSMKS